MVLAIVEELGHIGCIIASKRLAVEVTDEILGSRTAEHAAGIDVDYHHPLLLAVDRHREEVGALKLVGLGAVALTEGADVGPVLQIVRLIEPHLLVGRDNHKPALLGGIPEHLRVAEVGESVKRREDGVVLILGEGQSVVGGIGHALYLSVLLAGRGIEGNDGAGTVASGVVDIDDRRTREDMPHGVAGQCCGLFGPVEEVAAHGVTPMHVAPLRAIGIVLIIEVPDAILIEHAVGVVHPTVGRRMVIHRAIVVGVDHAPLVGQLHTAHGDVARLQSNDLDHGLLAVTELEGHIVVDRLLCQTHVHPRIGGQALVELHLLLAHILLDGQNEVFGGIGDGDDGGVALGGHVHRLGGD